MEDFNGIRCADRSAMIYVCVCVLKLHCQFIDNLKFKMVVGCSWILWNWRSSLKFFRPRKKPPPPPQCHVSMWCLRQPHAGRQFCFVHFLSVARRKRIGINSCEEWTNLCCSFEKILSRLSGRGDSFKTKYSYFMYSKQSVLYIGWKCTWKNPQLTNSRPSCFFKKTPISLGILDYFQNMLLQLLVRSFDVNKFFLTLHHRC